MYNFLRGSDRCIRWNQWLKRSVGETFFIIVAASYEGCLRTPIQGIKLFVVHFEIKVLTTCFPVSSETFKV